MWTFTFLDFVLSELSNVAVYNRGPNVHTSRISLIIKLKHANLFFLYVVPPLPCVHPSFGNRCQNYRYTRPCLSVTSPWPNRTRRHRYCNSKSKVVVYEDITVLMKYCNRAPPGSIFKANHPPTSVNLTVSLFSLTPPVCATPFPRETVSPSQA